MQELRANTAVDVLIGPFVDDADGDTPITGSTLVVELSKLGQALATKNEGTNPAHDAAGTVDGYYNCMLDTTDTNSEGTLVLVVHHADSLPVRHDFMVLAEAAWDSKYVAKDDGFMDVNIKTIGRVDTQETEANNLESSCSNYSVTRGLTGTALPSAVADAAGGVPISDAGGLALDTQLANTHEVTAARMGALTDWINGGRLDLILDIIAADVVNIDGAAMRGTDSAGTAANLATVDTVVDAIKAVTDLLPEAGALTTIGTDTARLTAVRAAVLTDWINGGRLDLLLDAIPTTAMRGTDSAALASVATEARLAELDAANLPTDIAALNDLSAADVNAEVVDVLRTDTIPDSYAADGAQPTIVQAIMAIQQYLQERAVSGTTVTVKKPDGSTTAMTLTLDDGTSPTSITRAT